MTIEYSINYKTVSKWGIDRGELGGLDSCEIMPTIDDAITFIKKFISKHTYKSMSYTEQNKIEDNTPILLYYTVCKRVKIFDLFNFVPRMRCIPPPSDKPTKYMVHGQYIKFRPHPFLGDSAEGYYCHTTSEIKSAWNVMKNKNNKQAEIYAYYEIKL